MEMSRLQFSLLIILGLVKKNSFVLCRSKKIEPFPFNMFC